MKRNVLPARLDEFPGLKTEAGHPAASFASQGFAAFAFMELLVVIAILAVLAAMLLPALAAKARRDAQQAGCVSNLRQVNLALQMWVDNNDGWLPPGPGKAEGLYMGQLCNYKDDTESRRDLAFYLCAYLGYPMPDAQTRIAQPLFCPGFWRNSDNITNMAWRVTYGLCTKSKGNLPDATGLPWNPFGYPAAPISQSPHKLLEVQSLRSLSEVWMMTDVDKVSITNADNSCQTQLADAPVHGGVRNYLFFDGHVTTRRIN